jgi:hypothetical protein
VAKWEAKTSTTQQLVFPPALESINSIVESLDMKIDIGETVPLNGLTTVHLSNVEARSISKALRSMGFIIERSILEAKISKNTQLIFNSYQKRLEDLTR